MKNGRTLSGYRLSKAAFCLVFILLGTFNLLGQTKHVALNWLEPVNQTFKDELITSPNLQDGTFEKGLPFFVVHQKVKRGTYQLGYTNVTMEPAPAIDVAFLARMHADVPLNVDLQQTVSKAREERYIISTLNPYVRVNGVIHRITGVDLSAVYTGPEPSSNQKDYVATSVLNEGNWYKISVSRDGIYKMDKAFLQSCGIDVATLHADHINIYGNAGGRLSEQNNGLYYDDLTKNPIRVVAASDTTWGDDDYILFYGAGPNRWDYFGGSGFERNQHIYSSVATYFIHISETDAPLRLTSLDEATGPENGIASTYDYIDIHEFENYNLVKGGQRWYGELFDGILTQEIAFSIPDVITSEPVTAQYAFAANTNSSGNVLQIVHNGSMVVNEEISNAGGDYMREVGSFNFNASGSSIPFSVTFDRVNPAVRGYLDYIEISARRSLKLMGTQFQFRDLETIGVGNTTRFNVSGMTSQCEVWDVSDKRHPKMITGNLSGGVFSFLQDTDTLREFIAFNAAQPLEPQFIHAVPNQNLHGIVTPDFVIVTHPDFTAQANRLATLHEQNGTSTIVVTTEQVYNEYSSGMQDATAIRRFVKMFYDRANGDPEKMPKHLLLFGDATYDPKDRVGNNNYMVPTYEMVNSEDHIASMVTDDYFGMLDNNESINGTDLMDVGVGRLLISTNDHAVEQVNKIEHYMKNGSQLFSGGPNDCCTGQNTGTFGDWRLNYTIITDDEENGYFVKLDAEPAVDEVQALYPEMNYDKIYSDAYQQTSTAGGQRYPDVFEAITDRVERGSLVVNYIGHGGEVGVAEERIITIPQIQGWSNIDRLALFVTATCEFTRFDDPSRVSAGEWVSLNPIGGAIALMTTSRSVFFGVNSSTIEAFYEHVFQRDANHRPLAFGEIMRQTKNTSDTFDNRRSFTLIGDPALPIALPMWRIVTDSINHHDPDLQIDTVRALSKMTVKGHLEDYDGNVLSSYNGVLSPTIFDKEKVAQTLSNDSQSPLIEFNTRNNALYKGKASVTNGYFSFDCIVPKDINYSYGHGKISYYSYNSGLDTDADGSDTNFVVGGINPNAAEDNQGPTLALYLNDDRFVNGGITSPQPVLIVDCFDENGINTVGNGVGHDLVAILDGNSSDPIVLNNYYSGKLDSYQAGQIIYTLRSLAPGLHTLEVKVWDSNNNSSTARIEFTVVADANVQLDHVLNYPNPFTTNTTFFFEHNQSCSTLETQINIYTVSGRLVKTINEDVATSGFRVDGITWDGKDDFGDQLAKGVYVYRVSVKLPDGGTAEKLEKLVLLR